MLIIHLLRLFSLPFLSLWTLVTIQIQALPLSYRPNDVLEGRGCGTYISDVDRWEVELALKGARSIWDELEEREYASEYAGLGLEEREEEERKAEAMTTIKEQTNTEKEATKAGKETRRLKQVSFDVYWHVVYANETKDGGYVSDQQITDQMKVMNDDFKSTNISWNMKNITRIESPDWFVNVWPGSPQEQEMKKRYHKGDSSVLNIFTAQFNSTTKSLGFASLPSSYLRDPLSDGLIIRHSTLPGGTHTNYNHGRTTVHELGHWLGLYHTFEGGCEGVGDNIDDTAPEASGAEGCPVGRKSCVGVGGKEAEEDPIHNFMDYSFDTCMTHFTPGQAVRMHEVVWAFRTKRALGPGVGNSTTTSTTTLSPASTVSLASVPSTASTTDTSAPSTPPTSTSMQGLDKEEQVPLAPSTADDEDEVGGEEDDEGESQDDGGSAGDADENEEDEEE